MKLRGYDVLQAIRAAGAKPTHICIFLFPVKRLPCRPGFVDTDLSTLDETSGLGEYDLDAVRGLDVILYGRRKDDRLRGAFKALARLANRVYVGSDEHEMVDIYADGRWV